ncbi:MAG: phosphatase PAP2 family protein [Rhodocyclaceae bacterium]|nr:phosphatase PAP2 family protein [Rhodocyclaceae bacterium]
MSNLFKKIQHSGWALLCFAAAVVLFIAAPGIDLAASALFYRPGEGFFLADAAWVRLIYHGSPRLAQLWLVLVLLAVLASLWPRFSGLRRPALFLLAVLVLTSGVAISVLKDNWGRARPNQIVEFGGDKRFTPAWTITDQCDDNCSFVSGHAGGAFSLLALAWVFPRRRRFWLVAGVIWGAHVGLVRMAQGGHFLSDVIFAGFVVYFCAALLARWVFYRPPS